MGETSLKIVATIEARMNSTRLPGKVLMEAAGKSFLAHMVERLGRVRSLDGIVIATTTNVADDAIVTLAEELGIGCHRGSEDDVLARVLSAAKAHDVDVIVETTGDCPLIDPNLVDSCIKSYLESDVDYVSNVLERTYPIGMDTQVFSTKVLDNVAKLTDDPDDREHVSLYIYRNPEIFKLQNVSAPPELSWPELGLTLDTPDDLRVIRHVFEALYPLDPCFDLVKVLELFHTDPSLAEINAHVHRKHI